MGWAKKANICFFWLLVVCAQISDGLRVDHDDSIEEQDNRASNGSNRSTYTDLQGQNADMDSRRLREKLKLETRERNAGQLEKSMLQAFGWRSQAAHTEGRSSPAVILWSVFLVIGIVGIALFITKLRLHQPSPGESSHAASGIGPARANETSNSKRQEGPRASLRTTMISEAFGTNLYSKEKSFFACKLYKLNDDGFHEPHEPGNWCMQEFWIGRQGVIYNYNEKDKRVSCMFNGRSIGRLHVKRLEASTAYYPLCISIIFPPSDNPDLDPKPAWFGTHTEDDLRSIMQAHDHFSDLSRLTDEAVFAGQFMKLNADAINEPLDKSHWRKRDIWVGTDGLMYYYSFVEESKILFFSDIDSIGELKLRILSQDATCYPFSIALTSPKVKQRTILGSDDEQVVVNFVKVWKSFKPGHNWNQFMTEARTELRTPC